MCIATVPGSGKTERVLVCVETNSDQGDPGAKRRKAWLIFNKCIRVFNVIFMHVMKKGEPKCQKRKACWIFMK
jgi:hypothetical protein